MSIFGDRCYVIAEAGSNHNGDFRLATSLIDVAARAGADAVKFQLFRAAQLYPRSAGKSKYLGSERSIYDIVRDMELAPEWLPMLAARAAERGLHFLVTGFDEASVNLIDPFVGAHKCASYELTHHPLLAHIARKKKPVIVSTGAATLDEVREAVEVIRAAGNDQIVLLQCTASYPTPPEQANVRALSALATLGHPVGLSDHTREPTVAPCAAVALGAVVIEKHFTLDNELEGPDHRFAVEPPELEAMVRAIRRTERVLGHGRKEALPVEAELRSFARRSIFTVRSIRAGETLDSESIAVLRCGELGSGLPPSAFGRVVGMRATRDLPAEKAITHADVCL